MQTNAKLIVFSIIFLDYAGLNAVATLLPTLLLSTHNALIPISPWLNKGAIWMGVTIALYAFGQSIGAFIWGRLSDRLGRKPILQRTVIGNMLGLLLAYCGVLIHSIGLLLLGRLLSGLAAGNVAVGLSIMSDLTADQNKALNYRIIQMAIGLGLTVGPLLITLYSHVSLNLPWLVLMVLQGILIFVIRFFFKETLHVTPRFLNSKKTVMITPVMRWVLWVWILYVAGLMLFGQFLPSLLAILFHLSVQYRGIYLFMMGLVYVFSQFFMVKWIARWLKLNFIVKSALGLVILSILLLTIVTTAKQLWLISMIYYGSLAVLMPNLYAVVSNTANAGEQGSLMGRVSTLQGIATIFTSLLGGLLLEHYTKMIMVGAALLMFGAWFLFLYGDRKVFADRV